jgi:thioesterase domain-containing protein
LARLAQRLAARRPANSIAHAVELRPGGTRPLFLIHALGGGVSFYLAPASELPDGQAVVAFQAAGLDGGPPAAGQGLQAIAALYVDEMLQLQRAGPFRLGGWSMGGLIAFEMARQLEALGHEIEILILLDSPAPDRAAKLTPSAWPLGEYLADLAQSSGQNLPLTANDIACLTADRNRDATATRMARAAGLIPNEITDEILNRRLAVFEANQRALLAYRPDGPFGGDAVLLRAEDAAMTDDPGAWRSWIRGSLRIKTIRGDHYSMLRGLGSQLTQLLTEASSQHRAHGEEHDLEAMAPM